MKLLKITIRTKILILILLIIASGVWCALLFLESLHQVRNAGMLKQDATQLSKDIARVDLIVHELDKPSTATPWIDDVTSGNDEISKIISECSMLTEQLSYRMKLVQNEELEGLSKTVSSHFGTYKKVLIRVYSDFQERGTRNSGLTGQLYKLTDDLNQNANISGKTPGSNFTTTLKEYSDEWVNSGEPINLEHLRLLVSESVAARTTPDANNTDSRIVEIKTVVDRLLLLQQSLHKETGDGLLVMYTLEQDQLRRALNRLLSVSVHYEQYCFQLSIYKISFTLSIVILLLVVYLFFFSKNLQTSMDDIKNFLTELVSGRIPEKIQQQGNDEFTDMAVSLETFSADLQKKARFANGIGQGNLESVYIPLSDDDQLGNALIGLQKNLQEAKIEQTKHEAEEKKRRWINEGLTKFAEILRMNNNDIEALSDQIVQNTVSYLDANQGGLFLINEVEGEEPMLELISSFAYNRKKYLYEKIRIGEGLVGTCAIEKEPILLTEVPDEYLTITSGLGESNPRCIILVPLKLEEKVLGVIEIASFIVIEKHQLDFLVKVAESIASTIATVRINMRTETLLEQSQQQSQILADQEEEMRQSMEELQATQEESKRRETEITGILNAINSSSLVLEFDMLERVSTANERFCALVDTSLEHIRGKKYSSLFTIDITSDAYVQLWEDLKMGLDKARVECIRSSTGPDIWVSMNLTPLRQYDNKIAKVLCIAHDISDSKIQEQNLQKQSREITRKNQELESLNHAVDTALLRCAYDREGNFLEANDNYLKLTGYNLRELVGKDSRAFLKPDEQLQFDKIWAEVTKDKSYTGVIKRTKPTGEELWLMSNFTPVKDEKGNIYKIYYLGQDITERKLKYKLLEEANKEIERLKAQLGGR